MRLSLPILWLAVHVAWAAPASAQLVFLQNDSFAGGSVNCNLGIGDSEMFAAKFTAAAGQYPYTIDRVRVFGCGAPGAFDGFVVYIFQDDGGTVVPGPFLWQSTSYVVDGGNVFNDLILSAEATPPPTITSGSIRIALIKLELLGIGIGTDTDGITSQRNYLRSTLGVWSYAESQGVTGDWILRLGILPNSPVELLSFEIE